MRLVTPLSPAPYQVWNIANVIGESNCEQRLTPPGITPGRKALQEKFAKNRRFSSLPKTVIEKKGVPETEIIFLRAPPVVGNRSGVVMDQGLGYVDTLPIPKPELPAQIHVLAIHEKQFLVEPADFLERPAPYEGRGSGTPGRFTRFRIERFGMFHRRLPGLADRNSGVGLGSGNELFQATRVQSCVGIENEDVIATPLLGQQVHASREAVVPQRTNKSSGKGKIVDVTANLVGRSVGGSVVQEKEIER